MEPEGNKDVLSNKALSLDQSSTSGVKRKRGRPRKNEYPISELQQRAQPTQSVPPFHGTRYSSNVQQDGVQGSHTSGGSVDPKVLPGQPRNLANLVKTSDNQTSCYSNVPLQGTSEKDGILGKHFVGKMTKKCPGFSLITVKVKDNQVLRGWVPDENDLRPITPKDDLAPDLPMLRPSQIRKRASGIQQQPAPVPVHLEDVTIAKPLQMRRPVENTIAKHTAPLPPRPYMGSGVVAAVPLSSSHGNVETRTLSKQNTEIVIPRPSVSAIPLNSIRPEPVSCNQVANQDTLVREKPINEIQKDFESSDESKESPEQDERPNTPIVDVVVRNSPGDSQLLNVPVADEVRASGQTEHVDTPIMDETNIASDTTPQSEELKTETSVLKGVDDPKIGPSDDIHAVDKHEARVDSK